MASLPTPKTYANVFIWVWSTFPTTGAGNAILTLFIIRFTNDGGSGPGGRDFLCFLVLKTTDFFLITVSEMEQLLKL